ncbi:NAD(P)/FAD-dependent oxidoreductase [Candidatus Raskinella chloraquaticus]|uniref:NAD/FAD-binding protein n=1 Tax=Candidatus Raskinella chloraquaticus TaxID=1951219 RepID=A0A1W9HX29_9HYPH|nr:MAG: NAD/FAD-binding protein [Proteobacteria bacterium SG_bin8]
MRIAIIGSGISGLGAAYGLRHEPGLVVYEAEPRLGGHAHTVDIDYLGTAISVDTGFIVYNQLNYPNLIALFAALDVATKESTMSFSVSVANGRREWAGDRSLWKVFAQPSNVLRPSFLWMLKEIVRFNRLAAADLASGALHNVTLGDYLDQRRFSRRFRSDYLIPMGAAIWSMPADRVLQFPVESFVSFFDNHRLLSFDQPLWRTVDGGSRAYVSAMEKHLGSRVRRLSRVERIVREGRQVILTDQHGGQVAFDQAIIATHADQALAMIQQPSDDERNILGAFAFAENEVWLHRDPALMPKRRAAWAAWNYLAPGDGPEDGTDPVAVTYCMNMLQGIAWHYPLFVSLNPPARPKPELTFARFAYRHPQMSRETLAAQQALARIQGKDRLWFAGAWSKHGFHEDGLVSGMRAAQPLGGDYPWVKAPLLREAAE